VEPFPTSEESRQQERASRTERAVVAKFNAAALDALKDPDIKSRLEIAVGGGVLGSTPAQMKKLIETEIAKWSAVVDKARISKI
jgi:tripartite-type tricarboxylate transporter receptor subunit TctC